MNLLPQEDLVQNLKSLDFDSDDDSLQRSSGLYLNLELDVFTFKISVEDKPFTRRGILSTLKSLYDHLGIVAPVILRGKLILRKIITQSVDWDKPLSEQYRLDWETWKSSLCTLLALQIPRMYLPNSLSITEQCTRATRFC